jgi:hypothetical protein
MFRFLWELLLGRSAVERRLDEINASVRSLSWRIHVMSAQLEDLRAAVEAENVVIDSAVTLIAGLAAQIAALPADDAAIAQLAADVRAKSDALAAAVAANTPA